MFGWRASCFELCDEVGKDKRMMKRATVRWNFEKGTRGDGGVE